MSDDPILALISRAKKERAQPPVANGEPSWLDRAAGALATAKRKLKGDKPSDDGRPATIGIRG